jgi:magnesium chelatase family protein
MKIRSARDLRSVVRYLQGLTDLVLVRHTPGELSNGTAYPVDISTIIGQQQAKRAVEIAASGGHHIVLAGPPGVGKTLLAHSLQSILPPLTVHERLEVASIYSLSRSHPQVNLGTIVPFRSPHHTASETVLLGGSSTPRPGEVSLAHNGILFLDEMPEFSAVSLESLRQPLEAKCITINRPTATVTYPADFLLVGAHNPCPCGYLGDSRRECTCSAVQIARYKSRLSGPLLDRIDLQVSLVAETQDINIAPTETSKQVQTRVLTTRAIQLKRYASDTFAKNSQIPAGMLSRYCSLAHSEAVMLERITRHYQLSLRGSHKVLRVARTIADMAGSESILEQHLAEACLYRF